VFLEWCKPLLPDVPIETPQANAPLSSCGRQGSEERWTAVVQDLDTASQLAVREDGRPAVTPEFDSTAPKVASRSPAPELRILLNPSVATYESRGPSGTTLALLWPDDVLRPVTACYSIVLKSLKSHSHSNPLGAFDTVEVAGSKPAAPRGNRN